MALRGLELLLCLVDEVLDDAGAVGLGAECLVGDDAHVAGRFEGLGEAFQGTINDAELLLVEFKGDALVADGDGSGHGASSEGCERTRQSSGSMPFKKQQKV